MVKIDEDLAPKILDENIKVHREEAQVYDKIHPKIFNGFQQKELIKDIEFIVEQLSAKNPSALDIGCGTGNISLKLLRYGFSVTGVDISREMLDILRKKTVTARIRLVESDIDSFLLKESGKYDVIIFSSVLHHLPIYIETIKKVIKLLNKEGTLYITHEPPKKVESNTIASFFWSAVRRLDNILYSFILHLNAISVPSLNYTYSDYHTTLNTDLFIKILKENKFEIVLYKEYIILNFALFSIISNKILSNKLKIHAGPLRCFKLIAKFYG